MAARVCLGEALAIHGTQLSLLLHPVRAMRRCPFSPAVLGARQRAVCSTCMVLRCLRLSIRKLGLSSCERSIVPSIGSSRARGAGEVLRVGTEAAKNWAAHSVSTHGGRYVDFLFCRHPSDRGGVLRCSDLGSAQGVLTVDVLSVWSRLLPKRIVPDPQIAHIAIN
jgi:hypothetical protein